MNQKDTGKSEGAVAKTSNKSKDAEKKDKRGKKGAAAKVVTKDAIVSQEKI